MKISPENALYTGIFAAICLYVWYVLDVKDEKKEEEKNKRFYSSYGSFM